MIVLLEFALRRLVVQLVMWQVICVLGCGVMALLGPFLVWLVSGYFEWPPNIDIALKTLKAGVVSGLIAALVFFVRDIGLFLKGYR